MESWLRRALTSEPGFERELVDRYSRRLMELARRQLPPKVQQRVDPEDVVQSVYRSLFRRLSDNEFEFSETHDVWRLLAAMTYRKANMAARFHLQQRWDVRREMPLIEADTAQAGPVVADVAPGPDDVATLFDFWENVLAQLQSYQRDVVALRLEGDSVEEIAQRIQRSQSTVFRVLARVQNIAELLWEERP